MPEQAARSSQVKKNGDKRFRLSPQRPYFKLKDYLPKVFLIFFSTLAFAEL